MQATGLLTLPTALRPTTVPIPATGRRATEGCIVSIHFTLHLGDGKVIESTSGRPLQFLQGAGNVVPGLERQLENRRIGDRLSIEVPPEQGYGFSDPGLIQKLPRSDFPRDARFVPGMRFGSQLDDGTVLPAWVAAVDEQELTIDFNHPLADETLHFVVEVVCIRDARPDELLQGHPTGPGSIQR